MSSLLIGITMEEKSRSIYLCSITIQGTVKKREGIAGINATALT